MDPLRAIAEELGVFLTQEAKGCGYDDRSIARAVRGKLWHRVRRGAFVHLDTWLAADDVARHRIRARAVARSYAGRVALSHVTAAIEHGMDVWGVDLSRVHVTRLDGGAGRRERDVVHHEGVVVPEVSLVERGGLVLTAPTRAAIETASLLSSESALVTVDSALHRGLVTAEALRELFEELQFWPHTQHLQVVLRMADGRAESPGESRARFLFYAYGIPRPTLQHEVFDASGVLIGRTDFAWLDHKMLGEFDGRSKYGRLLRAGHEPGDAVFEEKVREDALRRTTGFGMVRLIWSDLARPGDTALRVRGELRRRAA